MIAILRWPTGATASFDVEIWISNHPVWGPSRLADVSQNVSNSVPDWPYWHAVDVAAELGAVVITPAPALEPVLAFGVIGDEQDE